MNSLIEFKESKTKLSPKIGALSLGTHAGPRPLSDFASGELQARITSGFSEVDRVLGGGFLQNSILLLGGVPGIGKSTLLLQTVGKLSGVDELIEAIPTDRVLERYSDGKAKTLMTDLFWANGVLLDPSENFLLVAEVGFYRIWKLWLKGEKAGSKESWVDALPGFPNGLSYSHIGNILVGIIVLRSRLLDAIHPLPWLKRIFSSIPEWMQARQSQHGMLLEYSLDGKLQNAWSDMGDKGVVEVSSAEAWGEHYVLGRDRPSDIVIVDLK